MTILAQELESALQLAFLPVAVIAKFAQFVMFAFKIGTCDIVQDQGRRRAVALEIAAKECFFDFLLTVAEIVEGVVKIFFVKLAQAEHFGDGMIGGPTDGGQTRALMGDAGQDQKQGQFAGFGLTEGGGKADVGGDLFERMQEAENRSGGGFGKRSGIEFTAQEAAQDLDARARPGSDVGEGAVFDVALFVAVRLADEEGGRRSAVGDVSHVHASVVLHSAANEKKNIISYMTTKSFKINNKSL